MYVSNSGYDYRIRPFWPIDTWFKFTWLYLGDGKVAGQRGTKIYKNGAYVGGDDSPSTSTNAGQSRHLVLGKRGLSDSPHEYANMEFDSLIAWDTVLTEEEINLIHQ